VVDGFLAHRALGCLTAAAMGSLCACVCDKQLSGSQVVQEPEALLAYGDKCEDFSVMQAHCLRVCARQSDEIYSFEAATSSTSPAVPNATPPHVHQDIFDQLHVALSHERVRTTDKATNEALLPDPDLHLDKDLGPLHKTARDDSDKGVGLRVTFAEEPIQCERKGSSRRTRGSEMLRKLLVRPSRGSNNSDTARKGTRNKNSPQDYTWLEDVLLRLAQNEGRRLGCLADGQEAIPIFFMLGACPNPFCGMQVIMYTLCKYGVDFWWVKPEKAQHTALERNTLNRNVKGPHKNEAKGSKPFYKPLADLFEQRQSKDGWRFGIETAPSSSSRAFIERDAGDGGRLYWHVVWMEDWTSNPFARAKYLRGKIVYQKDLSVVSFCARQFSIVNGRIQISEHEEMLATSVIPAESVKWLTEAD